MGLVRAGRPNAGESQEKEENKRRKRSGAGSGVAGAKIGTLFKTPTMGREGWKCVSSTLSTTQSLAWLANSTFPLHPSTSAHVTVEWGDTKEEEMGRETQVSSSTQRSIHAL